MRIDKTILLSRVPTMNVGAAGTGEIVEYLRGLLRLFWTV